MSLDEDLDDDAFDGSFIAGSLPLFGSSSSGVGRSHDHMNWQDATMHALSGKSGQSAEASSLLEIIDELSLSMTSRPSKEFTLEDITGFLSEIQHPSSIEATYVSRPLSVPIRTRAHVITVRLLTRWIIRRILEHTLDTILDLNIDLDFWKGRLRVRKPLRDLLEQGPLNWFSWSNLFGSKVMPLQAAARSTSATYYPRINLQTFRSGIKPFISIVNLSGKIELQVKVSRLVELKKLLLRRAGLLHHNFFQLNSAECESTPTLDQWTQPILGIYRLCTEREPPTDVLEPINPESALRLLSEIVDVLPAMEQRLFSKCVNLHRPGHFQRYWLGYSIAAFVGVISVRKAVIHRDYLRKFVSALAVASKDFWEEHVSLPLYAIHQRLIRPRVPTTKPNELLHERNALEVMLREFGMQQVERNPSVIPVGTTKEKFIDMINANASEGNISLVLQCYRNEISKPFYSLAAGDLLRSLLIQLQKLKVDLETSLLDLDVMLERNEITLELATIVPAILVLIPLILLILYPASIRIYADTKRHRRMRASIQSIHRILICNYVGDAIHKSETIEDSGKILAHVHNVAKLAITLRSQNLISLNSFLKLRKDIKRLVSLDYNVHQKRLLLERMYEMHFFLSRIG